MKRAADLIPWKVTDVSLRPYRGMWSFNPSIHYDGVSWRCVMRCSDYAMPGGIVIRSSRATPGEASTKNAMVILDPASWKPVEIYKMRERDGLAREAAKSVGYEDMRLFRTEAGGLQGIAASLHLRRGAQAQDRPRHRRAEQVLLSFDNEYNISGAQPLRGPWSNGPQKNWAPFDNCVAGRFLYSIGEGTLFDERGPLAPTEAYVQPSRGARVTRGEPEPRARRRAGERAVESLQENHGGQRRRKSDGWNRDPDLDPIHSIGTDLRGGSQLIHIGGGRWLGIGHAMRLVDDLKYYWHVWYLVDARGKMTAASIPMKLAPNGIEFAAGMGIDGDRVVVSFGVDDMECKIGETHLSAVLEVLQKVGCR